MAKPINAVTAYGPKIDPGVTVSTKELVSLIAGRSGLNKGDILHMIYELQNALIFYHRIGRAVKLEGVGVFTPTINKDGKFTVSTRIAGEIKDALNEEKAFQGKILNRDMLGKTMAECIERWNSEHPDDQIDS